MYQALAAVFVYTQIFTVVTGIPLTRSVSPVFDRPHITTIHEFPRQTWMENLYQRPSGLILATEFSQPNLWELDPSQPASQTPQLIARFPSKLGLYGIVEYTPDIYAVIGGNFTFENGTVPGSYSIYSVDFRITPARVMLLKDIHDAAFLNGLTFLPPSKTSPKGRLLATDPILGIVWALDLVTLQTTRAVEDPLMARCDGDLLGINGIKYNAREQAVYFTNSFCQDGYLAKVAVDPGTGQAIAAASVVATHLSGVPVDDLALNYARNEAYIALGTQNVIIGVDLQTRQTSTIAGSLNSSAIANPTAVYVGRTADDRRRGRIYVTTTGGLEARINDTILIGGQVLAVDLGR